jgi:hypothetical protein
MARTVSYNPTVGQRVYQAYSPQRAGIITSIIPPGQKPIFAGSFPYVEVTWLDGTKTESNTLGLRDFDSLLEDHKKKLQTHQVTQERLNLLARGL